MNQSNHSLQNEQANPKHLKSNQKPLQIGPHFELKPDNPFFLIPLALK